MQQIWLRLNLFCLNIEMDATAATHYNECIRDFLKVTLKLPSF